MIFNKMLNWCDKVASRGFYMDNLLGDFIICVMIVVTAFILPFVMLFEESEKVK